MVHTVTNLHAWEDTMLYPQYMSSRENVWYIMELNYILENGHMFKLGFHLHSRILNFNY